MFTIGKYWTGDRDIKPDCWGNFSTVQSALFHNLERMGIDPGSAKSCIPFWSPGIPINYGIKQFSSVDSHNPETVFKNNYLELPSAQWGTLNNGYKCNMEAVTETEGTFFTVFKPISLASAYAGNFASVRTTDKDEAFGFFGSTVGVYGMMSTSTGYKYTTDNIISSFPADWYAAVIRGQSNTHTTFTVWIKNLRTGLRTKFLFSSGNSRFVHGTVAYNTVHIGGNLVFPNYYDTASDCSSVMYFTKWYNDQTCIELIENPYQLWQPVPQKTIFDLGADPTSTLLPIMMNMNQFNGGIYETD